jgi:hypothetical protein
MTDKPKRPVLTLKGRKKAAPAAPEKPQRPAAPKAPPKLKGPAYTPPKALEPFLERFWLVMRSSGRRPKFRHLTLEAAQEEAGRIAANCAGVDVWVIEARTVQTVRTEGSTDKAGAP